MKVRVENSIYLESDKQQFILKEYSGKTDSKGNETYTTLGYYDTIEQAIKKIYKLRINKTTATNLKELLSDHKQIHREIKELFE